MMRKTDAITQAARQFNAAIDESIALCESYHPDEQMLVIAKRKLNYSRKIDMLLPVQLTWDNRLLKGHGDAITNRDVNYFKTVSHAPYAKFGGNRNDVNANDINNLLQLFRNEWDTVFSDEIKNNIWRITQDIYKAYMAYGFAMRQ